MSPWNEVVLGSMVAVALGTSGSQWWWLGSAAQHWLNPHPLG